MLKVSNVITTLQLSTTMTILRLSGFCYKVKLNNKNSAVVLICNHNNVDPINPNTS